MSPSTVGRVTLGAVLALGTGSMACGVPAQAPIDGAAPVEMDSGPTRCRSQGDCDDWLFCDGPERCRPSDPDADPFGCVRGASPCTGSDVCVEDED